MRSSLWSPAAILRGGASIIGLLIVVVIILCLTVFWGPLAEDPATKVTQAQTYIARSQNVACQMNIDTMRTQITQMQLASSGSVTITPKILEKKGYLKPCPDGGQYVFQDGQIYCTKHNPPPAGSPTPEATPEATPALAAGENTATTATADKPMLSLGVGVGLGVTPSPTPTP